MPPRRKQAHQPTKAKDNNASENVQANTKAKDSGKSSDSSFKFNVFIFFVLSLLLYTFFAPEYQTIHENVIEPAIETEFGHWVNEKVSGIFPPELGVDNGIIGKRLNEEGVTMKHPVVFLPGFTTTSLELWQGAENCSHPVRSPLWGGVSMAKSILMDLNCWFKQMALDYTTGLDPGKIKVRSVEGFAGAMEFAEVFWIWNKIIENLVEVGYDSNNLHMASYDWRLSYENMEKRDRTLTKLKLAIEVMLDMTGEKTVLLTHSMGGGMSIYFMKWVESELGGKAGKNWVNNHIHATVNIAGAYLGMPKSAAAITSGEMKDTSQLGGYINEILEVWNLSNRLQRVSLFQSWPSLSQMLPKGGSALWQDEERDMGPLFFSRKESCNALDNITLDSFNEWFIGVYPRMKNALKKMAHGFSTNPTSDDPRTWYNPLETTLPNAPDMTLYSFYGVGKPTERSYYYHCFENETGTSEDHIPFFINTLENQNNWTFGVKFCDGDGTIPLISLGYLPAKQWREKSHNPYGVKIVTHELKHEQHPVFPRGGERTGDHVDILGNYELIEAVVKIAGGQELLEDVIHSDIVNQSNDAYDRLYAKWG